MQNLHFQTTMKNIVMNEEYFWFHIIQYFFYKGCQRCVFMSFWCLFQKVEKDSSPNLSWTLSYSIYNMYHTGSVSGLWWFLSVFSSQELNKLQQQNRWSNDLSEVFLLFTKLREYKTKTKLQVFVSVIFKCNFSIA